MVIDTFEFIILSCFSRILGDDEDSEVSLKGEGSNYKIQQAGSTVNTTETELLLASCCEIVFEQLQKYTKIMSRANTKKRKIKKVSAGSQGEGDSRVNQQRRISQAVETIFENMGHDLDDAQEEIEELVESAMNDPSLRERLFDDAGMRDTGDESDSSEGEENKVAEEQEEDHKEQPSEEQKASTQEQPIDYEKAVKMYDKSVVLKLLRLLEIFTAIGIKSKSINQFVTQVANSKLISTLMELSARCQEIQHSMVVMKILSNLITIGVTQEIINDTFKQIKTSSWGKDVFTISVKADFDNSFLQYLYNSLIGIRSKQWEKEQKNYGAFSTSRSIIKIFSDIMRSDTQTEWKTNIEKVLDTLLSNINDYSIVEYEAVMSILEGGEYQGLSYGSHGMTGNNSKFTVVGFVKDLESSNQEYEMNNEFAKTSDQLLAIYYDEKHPERNDMF